MEDQVRFFCCIRGAVPKYLHSYIPPPPRLENVSFCREKKNKKSLECSETQEYTRMFPSQPDIFLLQNHPFQKPILYIRPLRYRGG